MSAVGYLVRRGAMYYCRLRIPLDLVEVMGRRELIKSLGTRDLAEAKRLMLPVLTDWNRQFDGLRTVRRFTDADKPIAVWEHYEAALTRDDDARARLPTEADVEAATERAVEVAQRIGMDARDPQQVLDVALEVRALKNARAGPDSYIATAHRVKLDHIKRHLAQGETALINHEVDA